MRHPRIEPDAGEVEEQAALDLAGIDHPFASAERNLESRRRIEGDAELAREPLPDPLGMIASEAAVNASAEATSLTVPSPPHATHSDDAAPEPASASSRACPPRSVTNTSPSISRKAAAVRALTNDRAVGQPESG